MSKEIKNISSKKVNKNLLDFYLRLNKEKIDIKNNKEKVEKLYKEVVNLKFNNIKRLIKRSNREEVIERKNNYLVNNKLDLKVVEKIENKLLLVSNKRSNSYIWVIKMRYNIKYEKDFNLFFFNFFKSLN